MQITLKVRNTDNFRLGKQLDFNIEGMHGTAHVVHIDRKNIDITTMGDQYRLSEFADVTLAVDSFVDQKLGDDFFLKTALDKGRSEVVAAMMKRMDEFVTKTYLTGTKEKPVKPKKFYIGKKDVCEGTDFNGWAKDSLPEAIEQAKAIVEKTGETQYIVKVIKVVKKKPQPVVVEDVK